MAEIPTKPLKTYPDISHLLEAKEKQRSENANRSFAEKIEIVKRLNAAAKLWKNSKVVGRT
ncbi:MAG TPA: hypothetical protein VGO50_06695 [Pyrinomonadaceae bacterium]|jgi:hypothetical protein|nr:hypothetical protein [Pyrinomonadaceae bacterium]